MDYSERIEALSTRLRLDPLAIEKVLRITDVLGLIAERQSLDAGF